MTTWVIVEIGTDDVELDEDVVSFVVELVFVGVGELLVFEEVGVDEGGGFEVPVSVGVGVSVGDVGPGGLDVSGVDDGGGSEGLASAVTLDLSSSPPRPCLLTISCPFRAVTVAAANVAWAMEKMESATMSKLIKRVEYIMARGCGYSVRR